MSSARILGMTVTGSAKHYDKVVQLKPELVIVEEAAHVVEANVVAGLTKFCRRLILIGDHKQLRPSTVDYDLTKANMLDVSMMERFVRNAETKGIQTWTQLDVQRRMRPEISELVCPVIYDQLTNDPIVFRYPNVKGMEKNLFFVNHNELEHQVKLV
jgi:superfamily I DNA and/or RNA helicase